MSLLCALVLLIIISALKGSFGQTVTQKERTMTVNQGARISLDCVYDKNVYYLFWYVQPPGKPPRIFLADLGDGSTSGEGLSHGFQAKHDKINKSFNMEKSASQLNDSAVYFCAVSESSNWKVTFGNGTRLVVTPNLENSEPSIYKLQPAKEEDAKISACLVTDYFPASIEVGAKGTAAQKVNSSIVIVKENDKETPSYGTVFWGPGEKADGCYAKQKEKTFQPELAESATTCSKTGGFETDESLNLLSLTVLGLRVIFLKCVAFNLLFTFHAWSS